MQYCMSVSPTGSHSEPLDPSPLFAPFSYARLAEVRARISPWIRHTPLERSALLSERAGFPVFLKLECWQVTGSFKPRIAFAKLLALPAEVRQRGVVASTAGGHGVGLSHAASALAVPCHVCVSAAIDADKLQRIQQSGAAVSVHADVPAAAAAAAALTTREGWTRVPAYDDVDVIAGDASVGLELLEDEPAIDTVVVGMGGGGLASGIGLAARSMGRPLSIYGVQPTTVAVLNRWLAAGRVDPELTRAEATGVSIADGLGAAVNPTSLTVPLLRALAVQPLDVDDAEIIAAMSLLLDAHQLLIEPSAAAPVAALLRHASRMQKDGVRAAALLLTGRNIGPARRKSLLGS
jgi:threonine dehydratase